MIEIQFWWLVVLPVFFGLGWLAARVDIKHVIAQSKSLPSAYFKGLNHLLAGETNKAIEVYVDIAKNHEETIELQFTLGHLFRRRGELERAIRMHQKLLARRDLSSAQKEQAQLDLAIDFIKAGLFDRAETLLHELSETNAAKAARVELLAIYQQEHEWQKAIEIAQQLRDESHTYQHEIAQFNCELAAAALIRNQIEQAQVYLENALSVHRQCVRARLMLGEILFSQHQVQMAIDQWLLIEAQDESYLSLVARNLLKGYEQLGKVEDGIELLIRYLQRYPELDVVDLIYEHLIATQGVDAAHKFVRERLRDSPSMPGLRKLLEAHLLVAPDDQKSEIELIGKLLHDNTREHTMYYCHECGFKTRQFFWHCPGCNGWETYAPIRGKRRKQAE
ncbi:lipopolysaccharide assembly protein LapB [Chitinibacter fontanus]|uniref:Lipopolysaccharide assembly protein B n=1 Tax=Chitinibacter fontanus TaxID=1737446 RepID=A0A7D5ZFZ3_9NEIS|nr:lipopolysaccharide assembly protein LapB [Chitinibacter fontanus]QLI82926.1 lipopolysaccharide assembly protein LapB [Chitinibacter fontanus]